MRWERSHRGNQGQQTGEENPLLKTPKLTSGVPAAEEPEEAPPPAAPEPTPSPTGSPGTAGTAARGTQDVRPRSGHPDVLGSPRASRR